MARLAQMLAAVLLSMGISAVASWLFHGRVGVDFLVTAAVAGWIVNTVIDHVTSGLRQRNLRLQREILDRESELRAVRAAAELAHEVRNPLSAVLGNLELALELLDDPRSPEDRGTVGDEAGDAVGGAVRDAVRDAHAAARHVYALLADLRRSGDPPAVEVRNPRAQLRDAGLAARAMVLAHLGPAVQIEVPDSDPPALALRRAHLVQILHNLVLNAAHATRPDAPNVVTIGHTVEGDAAHIVVADRGAGMPPEVVAHAFEAGFTTRGTSGGSGFGLSVVRQLVEAAGGRVAVDSTPEVGTVVHLWVPLATPIAAAEPG